MAGIFDGSVSGEREAFGGPHYNRGNSLCQIPIEADMLSFQPGCQG